MSLLTVFAIGGLPLVASSCDTVRTPSQPRRVETGFLDRTLARNGASHRYQVYVPSEYRAGTALPLIVDLHGNGMQGTDGLLPTAIGLASLIRADRSQFPCIVLFPQAPPDTLWLQPEAQELIMDELQSTIDEFGVDPGRVYLSGFSMGGTGAYRLAFKQPSRFAGLLIVAGRIVPGQEYGEALIEADRRAHPFLSQADPYAALAAGLKTLPVVIAHGAADDVVPVTESRTLAAALKQAGALVRYEEYADTGHVGAAQKAFGDADLFEWLLSRR